MYIKIIGLDLNMNDGENVLKKCIVLLYRDFSDFGLVRVRSLRRLNY